MNALLTLSKWGDQYDRQARLYPGLLTILPVLVLLVCVFGASHPLLITAVSLLIGCGAPLLLSTIARDLGKALEDRLSTQWGGRPTSILLRHRDTTIDALTKKEYHRIIGQGLAKSAPTNGLEQRNPEQADTFYRAGTAWLIAKTQDNNKHGLVFRENLNYGFQRNLRGLKWIGIALSLVALALGFLRLFLQSRTSGDAASILRTISITHILPITISAAMLLCWIFLVTEKSVRRAGFAYADRLIRTCDQLAVKPKQQRGPKN
jgi:hypothetical protein